MEKLSSKEGYSFDSYTEELLQKIKNENITIHPTVWKLLNHILGNRIHAINLILGDFLDTPEWIIKFISHLRIFLYKISGNRGKLHPIPYYIHRALNNTKQTREFLDRLREITREKREF